MHTLDYRQAYGNPHLPMHPGHHHNPGLNAGQMVMIGAAALAVGGLTYWGYQKHKANKASAEGNPGIWRN